jgi:hypothetical protein
MDSKGESLGIQAGDVLTFEASYQDGYIADNLKITYQTTLKNLSDSIMGFLRIDLKAGIGTRVEWVTYEDDPTLRGSLNFYNNTAAINEFLITSTRPISAPHITKAFAIPSAIPAFSGSLSVTTETFRVAAKAQNKLEELFDSGGKPLGLESGDEMSVRGTVGAYTENNVSNLVCELDTTATTMQDLLDKIQDNFELPTTDGTPFNSYSVGLNPAGSQDNIPDGSLPGPISITVPINWNSIRKMVRLKLKSNPISEALRIFPD